MPELFTSSEFLSAIAGAFVGGVIVYMTQRMALNAAKRDREEDRKLVREGLANSLLFKTIRIASNFGQIHRHVEECFEKGKEHGGEPYQFVQPILNPPSHIHFTPKEMGLLLTLKDDDIFNAVVPLDDKHNSLMAIVEKYTEQRGDLLQRGPTPQTYAGETVSGVITKEQDLALRPYIINVNSIIKGMRTYAAKDAKESIDALDRLHELLKKQGLVTFNLESRAE